MQDVVIPSVTSKIADAVVLSSLTNTNYEHGRSILLLWNNHKVITIMPEQITPLIKALIQLPGAITSAELAEEIDRRWNENVPGIKNRVIGAEHTHPHNPQAVCRKSNCLG